MNDPTFYLGTHRPNWLWSQQLAGIPLFVSDRTLRTYKTVKQATTAWALDSGGFTELSQYGEWTTPAHQYIARARRYYDTIGQLDFIAPQDWMCEPHMLKRTGLTVEIHQERTINSVIELRTYAPELPIIPVLQGWNKHDYLRHVDTYARRGINLEEENRVGIGSICRRQATDEAADIAFALQPLKLHAFGAKRDALAKYGALLASADSLAWSYAGRRRPDATCNKRACNNCLHYALKWRSQCLKPTRPTLWGIT